MNLKHIDRLKHLIENGKWNDDTEKRANELISDIRVVAKNEENYRLKGRIQRTIKSAKIIQRWGLKQQNKEWNIDDDALEVTIDTTYSGKKRISRNNRARVQVSNYGFEISGDGPLFVNQPSCNQVQIVIPDWNDIYEFIAEEKS